MTLLTVLAQASGVPAASVILFIIGAAFWLFSIFYGLSRAPLWWSHELGLGLMILAIGVRIIFAM